MILDAMTPSAVSSDHGHTGPATRSAPLAGLVGLVLYVGGSLSAGLPPAPDAPTATVVAHFATHRSAVLVGTGLVFLALPFLLWFVAGLKDTLASAGPIHERAATATVASWVVLIALAGAGMLPLAAIVWHGPAAAGDSLVQLAFDIANLSLYALGGVTAAATVIFPCLVIWRTGVLPRWIVALGVVELATDLVGLVGLLVRTGPDAGGYGAGLGPLVWAIWAGALCITMWRRGD
jgi:hypothetical protein